MTRHLFALAALTAGAFAAGVRHGTRRTHNRHIDTELAALAHGHTPPPRAQWVDKLLHDIFHDARADLNTIYQGATCNCPTCNPGAAA